MQHVRPFRSILVAAALVTSAVVAAVPQGAVQAVDDPCATTWCGGGEFHPVTPTRILDTRSDLNDVAPLGRKSVGNTAPFFDVDLLGRDPIEGGPLDGYEHQWLPDTVDAGDVLAVFANVTVVRPTVGGNLQAFPTGAAAGTSSVLNFRAGQTVPNLALLRPSSDGLLRVVLNGATAGTADVLIDVVGWLSTSSYSATDQATARGARLVPVAVPGRILDTRNTAALGPNEDRALIIRGADTVTTPVITDIVPDEPDVTAVVLNLTGIRPTAGTYLSVVPDSLSGSPAGTSNLNLVRNQVKAILVVVPIGADGKVHLYNSLGSTHVAVDVVGYLQNGFAENTRNGRIVPLDQPFRSFDTREAAFGAVPLGPGQAEDWSFSAFAGSVAIDSVSVGEQSALLGNLTNASLGRQYGGIPVSSYLSVYPSPLDSSLPPTVSNINTVEGAAVANMALVRYGSDKTVRVFNSVGKAHYLLDVYAVVLADAA